MMQSIFALKFSSIFQFFLYNMQLRGSNGAFCCHSCIQNNRGVTKKRKSKGKNPSKNVTQTLQLKFLVGDHSCKQL